MDATALIVTDFEADGVAYERILAEVGFDRVVRCGPEDPLRSYLDVRPELVVLDLMALDDECSLVGSIRVGGWRNVHVPVVVVGEDADRYLEAGASAVIGHDEVREALAIACMASYAERCRKLLERSLLEREDDSTALLSA